jgi:hypothetical protein
MDPLLITVWARLRSALGLRYSILQAPSHLNRMSIWLKRDGGGTFALPAAS